MHATTTTTKKTRYFEHDGAMRKVLKRYETPKLASNIDSEH
jgi:hypothetical protein